MNTRKLTILAIVFAFWVISANLAPILELTVSLSSIMLALLIPYQISMRDAMALKTAMISIVLLLRPDLTQLLAVMWNGIPLLKEELPISANLMQVISPIYVFAVCFAWQFLQIRQFNKALKSYLVTI